MGGAEVLDLARTAIWVTIKIAAPVMRLLRSEDPVKIGTLLEALNSDAI